MIRTLIHEWDSTAPHNDRHHPSTTTYEGRRWFRIVTRCGCRLNKNLRDDRVPVGEDTSAVCAAHAALRREHLAANAERRAAVRREVNALIRKKGAGRG